MKMSRTVPTDVPTSVGATARSTGRSLNASRRFLLLCLSPLFLLGATCAASAALHHQQEKSHLSSMTFPGVPTGAAADEARTAATTFLGRLLGHQTAVRDSILVSAYSLRQQKGTEAQWSVLCETDSGNYLLRINARTHRVYAMNRMENAELYARAAGEYTGEPTVGAETPVSEMSEDQIAEAESDKCAQSADSAANCELVGRRLTRVEAQIRALNYLSKLGIAPASMETVPQATNGNRKQMAASFGRTYHFSFRGVNRPAQIEVGVSSTNGRIQTLWSSLRPI